jgi:hypothetical protein
MNPHIEKSMRRSVNSSRLGGSEFWNISSKRPKVLAMKTVSDEENAQDFFIPLKIRYATDAAKTRKPLDKNELRFGIKEQPGSALFSMQSICRISRCLVSL